MAIAIQFMETVFKHRFKDNLFKGEFPAHHCMCVLHSLGKLAGNKENGSIFPLL